MQDFPRSPLLQLGRHQLAAFYGMRGSVARALEAGIIDEILPIEREAHAGPFVVGQCGRCKVSVLRCEYQVGPELTFGGIALIADEG